MKRNGRVEAKLRQLRKGHRANLSDCTLSEKEQIQSRTIGAVNVGFSKELLDSIRILVKKGEELGLTRDQVFKDIVDAVEINMPMSLSRRSIEEYVRQAMRKIYHS